MAKGTKIRPLQDRIIVERIEAEEKTASGLYIPDAAKEKPVQGIVLSVGEGKRLENGTVVKPGVAVNDRVLFGKYSGTEVKVDGKEVLILREEDIFGVVVTA